MKRSAPLKRGKPLQRKARLKARKVPKAFRKRRDLAYQAWVRTHGCLLWRANAPPYWRAASIGDRLLHACLGAVQSCHVRSRGAGGNDHANILPLCAGAHEEQHRIGIRSFQARWGISLADEAKKLYAQYLEEQV